MTNLLSKDQIAAILDDVRDRIEALDLPCTGSVRVRYIENGRGAFHVIWMPTRQGLDAGLKHTSATFLVGEATDGSINAEDEAARFAKYIREGLLEVAA